MKPRVHLVPPEAILAMAQALTYGPAVKGYDDWGWKNMPEEDILDALYRHLLDYQQGNLLDAESGLPTLAHAAARMAQLVAVSEARRFPDYYEEGSEAYPFNHLRLVGEATRSLKGGK